MDGHSFINQEACDCSDPAKHCALSLVAQRGSDVKVKKTVDIPQDDHGNWNIAQAGVHQRGNRLERVKRVKNLVFTFHSEDGKYPD